MQRDDSTSAAISRPTASSAAVWVCGMRRCTLGRSARTEPAVLAPRRGPSRRPSADRQELRKLLRAIEPGDVLIVSRLDRLARSTRDLLNILDAVAKAGAGFRSLKDAWADTTTPHGRLMLTILGGLAEFERELIRARTGEGRKRAKARGVRFGRPRKLNSHQRQEALQRLAAGETQADIARTFGVDATTIGRLAPDGGRPFRLGRRKRGRVKRSATMRGRASRRRPR
jgi:DNA invertase Pin-like site-specific DNA recombinase